MDTTPPTDQALTARLAAIRTEIDAVDAAILALLNRRADLSCQVGQIKARGDGCIFKPQREQNVLAALAASNSGPLPEAHLRAIWHEIFASSRALQEAQLHAAQLPHSAPLPPAASEPAVGSKACAPVCISLPPSKSLSHRYLMAAALARGTSVLDNVLDSDDIRVTRHILSRLGAVFTPLGTGAWRIDGLAGRLVAPQGATDIAEPAAAPVSEQASEQRPEVAPEQASEQAPEQALDCPVRESGTSCRLLTALLAAGQGRFYIHGTARMHQRPMDELTGALRTLGADISHTGREGCPPLLLQAHGLQTSLCGGSVCVSMERSSQYFSGLLMAAPLADGPLRLELGGSKAVSWPYVGLTLQCLEDFGINFCVETRLTTATPWQALPAGSWRGLHTARPDCLRVTVYPGQYAPLHQSIEADWSTASYFLAAGALGPQAVCVQGLRADSLQGDRAMLDILHSMGATVSVSPHATEQSITVFPSCLHGVELDMAACPDLVPTVAIMAAAAEGMTRIRHVGHLRLKECDRLAAPATELRRLGIDMVIKEDGLCITGDRARLGRELERFRAAQTMLKTAPLPPRSGNTAAEQPYFSSHNDHRMAMSLALLERLCPGLSMQALLDAPQVVEKSFPQFWSLWRSLRCALPCRRSPSPYGAALLPQLCVRS